MIYKIINNLMLEYTRDPVPQLNQPNYAFCNQPVVGQIKARTAKCKSSFSPDSLHEWRKLDPEIREPPSIDVFKIVVHY